MKTKAGILSKTTKNDLITYGMVIFAYIVVRVLVSTGHVSSLIQGLLVPFCTYAIVAIALNLTVGILGELSLGHAGFMCVGAFASAVFSLAFKETMPAGPRFFLALLIGAVSAAVIGFLVGIPVLRLKGDYLAIVTLAFGEIIKNIINALYLGVDSKGVHFTMKDALALNIEEDGLVLIKGAQGVTGTPHDSNFTVGVVLVLVTLFIVLNFIHSRTGRAVMSIRDNRIAAESVGINVTKYKLIAFTLSASLAGVAGVLYAHNLSTLNALPKNFGYNMSILILVFVVLGGIGNIRGSIIAAVLLTLLPEVLRALSDYRMLIYAIVLIAMMIFNWSPNAIFFRKRIKQRLTAGRKAKEEE
ncbi:MAG: branched-chain amino acid ABC transporter permease [Lachnospiraceae bacterium]|nr:branched-chain amino acid ABC transporter permease [Lachnospiraceae bacterium]